jgi:hypothetical protein
MHALQAGWYEGVVVLPDAARWTLQIEDPQRSWRLTGAWQPSRSDAVALTPRG